MEDRGGILFVGLVTCYMLGRLFGGEATASELVVYGVTAAFGLEFVMVSWAALWQPGRQPY